MNRNGVSVSKIVERLDLKVYTDDIDLKKRKITRSDINRPALQLAGYFLHFDSTRVQIIGNVEYFYTKQMEEEKKLEIYKELLSYDIPCIIISRDLVPDEDFIRIAEENGIPVLGTRRPTSEFTAELIYALGELLAPCITVHGVLVDVYGEGVLITSVSPKRNAAPASPKFISLAPSAAPMRQSATATTVSLPAFTVSMAASIA